MSEQEEVLEACYDLNQAKVGQYVKTGRSQEEIRRIDAIWKNGVIILGTGPFKRTFKLWGSRGDQAYERGSKNGTIFAFEKGETVESVRAETAAKYEELRKLRDEKQATKETLTQRKIAAAQITHKQSQDVPELWFAFWTDNRGNKRTTVYAPWEDKGIDWDGQGTEKIRYRVAIGGYECNERGGATISSSGNDSAVSCEDALNRWIAAWYGPLPEDEE